MNLNLILEPNLFNPALFAGINPATWDIALEYLLLTEKYTCAFTCVRAHLFKIFQKVLDKKIFYYFTRKE
jgi:hypothetical protein